jgi:hypothetical protein
MWSMGSAGIRPFHATSRGNIGLKRIGDAFTGVGGNDWSLNF